MALLEGVDRTQRVGAGLLFLVVALAVLVLGFAEPVVTAVLAGANLLLSAVFLLTVGRDTTEDPPYDVGFWLLSVVVALAAYLGTSFLLGGTVDVTEILVFTVVFGIVLGLFAQARARFAG